MTPVEKETLENLVWKDIIPEYSYAGVAVFYDAFPVTKGHMIIVPMKLEDRFINYCFVRALKIAKERMISDNWDSYNIGFNEGEAAGRTVNWPHVHLIPRRKGDVKDPAGGVRGVISDRQNYRKSKHYKKKKK